MYSVKSIVYNFVVIVVRVALRFSSICQPPESGQSFFFPLSFRMSVNFQRLRRFLPSLFLGTIYRLHLNWTKKTISDAQWSNLSDSCSVLSESESFLDSFVCSPFFFSLSLSFWGFLGFEKARRRMRMGGKAEQGISFVRSCSSRCSYRGIQQLFHRLHAFIRCALVILQL